MNENEFYREASLHIFSKLKIEEALLSSLIFLRKVMPVDRMFFQFFEEDLNTMHIIAMATPKKAMKVDLLTPLSAKAIQENMDLIGEYLQQKDSDFIWLFRDNPKKYSAIREIFELHKMKVTSLMILPMVAGGKVLGGGSLVLTTEGDRKFTQQHADLISLLKDPFSISMTNALKHREGEELKELLADDNRYLHDELNRISGEEIIGADFGLADVMKMVRQVALQDSPVLLLGETGVGKDVIASAIHKLSERRSGPFISVNCGAIPDTLIDSELFGYEKGAFTGALSQKRGRFERADKGTLFLDEIGELPLQAQVRLLRVIQTHEIERVGGTKTIKLDIRIIAATNRNLQEMVESKEFREDLWFRLSVFPIYIPPLRERKFDIPAFLQHAIKMKSKDLKLRSFPKLAKNAIESLMEYAWPGNIRELHNVVERELIINPEGPLNFNYLTSTLHKKDKTSKSQKKEPDNLDEMVSIHIRKVLTKTNGKIHGEDGAAALLGINPSTLRNRMNNLGIEYGRSVKK
jgi:formate hydrogenlyase transcriptional activator